MSNGIRSLPRYQQGGVTLPDPKEERRQRLWDLMLERQNAPESTAGLPSLRPDTLMGEERGGIASLIGGTKRLASTFFGERSKTGYVPGVSEAIYNTMKPWVSSPGWSGGQVSYDRFHPALISDLTDAMSRIYRGDPGAPREGDRLRPGDVEDAWRTYLGLPQKHGTFEESEYRPTRGSGEDIRYMDFVDPNNINLTRLLGDKERQSEEVQRMALEQEWREGAPRRNELHNRITSLYRLENPSIHDTEELSRLKEEVGALEGVLNTPIKQYPEYPTMRNIVEALNDPTNEEGPFHAHSDLLGTYTLDKGEDERGSYVSYYDKWDLAHPAARISKAGQPFDIYGRMYYDPETYEYRGSNE
jgi:hypothetical protein